MGKNLTIRSTTGCASSKPNPHDFIGGFERIAIACVDGRAAKRNPIVRSEPRTRTALWLEAIALRHQIAVLERSRTRRGAQINPSNFRGRCLSAKTAPEPNTYLAGVVQHLIQRRSVCGELVIFDANQQFATHRPADGAGHARRHIDR